MNFYQAMVADRTFNDLVGENGMPTHSTSGNYLLDLFFKMGGSRHAETEELLRLFNAAYSEDKILAVKAMFYNRDVRGGQGERNTFRIFFRWLCVNYPEIARQVYQHVPFYGRWDDLLVALWTPIESEVAHYIWNNISNGLAAKWMPRDNKSGKELAKRLMELLMVSPRVYRKTLVKYTNVVETQMCTNNWNEIRYDQVPSKAMTLYKNAFQRHDLERFYSWLNAVEAGESKVNAGAIFPSDIVHKYIQGSWGVSVKAFDRVLEEQWKALPNFLTGDESFLPICDVSGSMTGQPMEVSVSLGIYLAQRNKSAFKDVIVTFSNRPEFIKVPTDSLQSAIKVVGNAPWGQNTDLERTFQEMLSRARKFNVAPEDMPTSLLIISDMQFDRCVTNRNANANTMLRQQYEQYGYQFPNVIFWNVRTSTGIPVKMSDSGVALVSGYSPSVMKSLLKGEVTPMSVMLRALNDPRYDRIQFKEY